MEPALLYGRKRSKTCAVHSACLINMRLLSVRSSYNKSQSDGDPVMATRPQHLTIPVLSTPDQIMRLVEIVPSPSMVLSNPAHAKVDALTSIPRSAPQEMCATNSKLLSSATSRNFGSLFPRMRTQVSPSSKHGETHQDQVAEAKVQRCCVSGSSG